MSFADLSNHVALVTGASGDLGRELAKELASAGASVAVHYFRDEAGALETAKHLPTNSGPHHVFQADLSTDEVDEVSKALIKEVKFKLGDITILVNNAADQILSSINEMDSEDWSAMQNATLRSAVALSRVASGEMLPGSSIVNISSVEAVSPFIDHSHYAAAKAGLEAFTKSSAKEFAKGGIRVNAVRSGLIDRENLEIDWPEGVSAWNQRSVLARPVKAQEVAGAVRFLASESASGITGEILTVDAGWLIG
ncbi:MAG: SDR family oxidoreductase [Candidatus Nanopelagicales bacterium]